LTWVLRGIAHAIFSIVEESGHGTRVLRTDLWRRFPIPVPPLNEQRAIAAFLDRETARIDELIAGIAISEGASGMMAKMAGLMKEYRSALITAAVTGQIDVSNYDREAACP
jgi:type I restriction enzyme, S subunit